jgi:hypothetical protein
LKKKYKKAQNNPKGKKKTAWAYYNKTQACAKKKTQDKIKKIQKIKKK